MCQSSSRFSTPARSSAADATALRARSRRPRPLKREPRIPTSPRRVAAYLSPMSRFIFSSISSTDSRFGGARPAPAPPDPYLVEELLLVVVDEYVDDLDPPFPFVSSLDDDEYLVRLVVVCSVNGSVVVDAASKADSLEKIHKLLPERAEFLPQRLRFARVRSGLRTPRTPSPRRAKSPRSRRRVPPGTRGRATRAGGRIRVRSHARADPRRREIGRSGARAAAGAEEVVASTRVRSERVWCGFDLVESLGGVGGFVDIRVVLERLFL